MNHKLYNTQALAAGQWSRDFRKHYYYKTENALCTKFALVMIRLGLL